MEAVFDGVAGPIATRFTRGAWLLNRRLMAIDGFEVDVPDTGANAAEFGYSGSGDTRSAFPKARVVALTECGTHVFVAAEVGAWATGEKTLANRLYPRLRRDELLTADRNFYSFTAWGLAADTGAALLWRAPTQLRLPVVDVLDDGTYVAVIIDPKFTGARRDRVLAAARSGENIGDDGHFVRVVEYDVPDRDGNGSGELVVLLSTILDPADASAEELAAAYHERWEQETAHDQLKAHLRGPGKILRSRLPDLVHQEIWAWLSVHYAITVLVHRAAEAADIVPDRISFSRALHIIRRTATGTAAFPPLTPGLRHCRTYSSTSPENRCPPDVNGLAPAQSNEPGTTATASKSTANQPAPVTPDQRLSTFTHSHHHLTRHETSYVALPAMRALVDARADPKKSCDQLQFAHE